MKSIDEIRQFIKENLLEIKSEDMLIEECSKLFNNSEINNDEQIKIFKNLYREVLKDSLISSFSRNKFEAWAGSTNYNYECREWEITPNIVANGIFKVHVSVDDKDFEKAVKKFIELAFEENAPKMGWKIAQGSNVSGGQPGKQLVIQPILGEGQEEKFKEFLIKLRQEFVKEEIQPELRKINTWNRSEINNSTKEVKEPFVFEESFSIAEEESVSEVQGELESTSIKTYNSYKKSSFKTYNSYNEISFKNLTLDNSYDEIKLRFDKILDNGYGDNKNYFAYRVAAQAEFGKYKSEPTNITKISKESLSTSGAIKGIKLTIVKNKITEELICANCKSFQKKVLDIIKILGNPQGEYEFCGTVNVNKFKDRWEIIDIRPQEEFCRNLSENYKHLIFPGLDLTEVCNEIEMSLGGDTNFIKKAFNMKTYLDDIVFEKAKIVNQLENPIGNSPGFIEEYEKNLEECCNIELEVLNKTNKSSDKSGDLFSKSVNEIKK